jgi:hypothetical protein
MVRFRTADEAGKLIEASDEGARGPEATLPQLPSPDLGIKGGFELRASLRRVIAGRGSHRKQTRPPFTPSRFQTPRSCAATLLTYICKPPITLIARAFNVFHAIYVLSPKQSSHYFSQ